jgi:hypothetical protein
MCFVSTTLGMKVVISTLSYGFSLIKLNILLMYVGIIYLVISILSYI